MFRGRFGDNTISAEDAYAVRELYQMEKAAGRDCAEPFFLCQDDQCDARVYPSKRERVFALSHYPGQGLDCELRHDISARFLADLDEARLMLGNRVRQEFFTVQHLVNTYFFMNEYGGTWDETARKKFLAIEDFRRAIRLIDAAGVWYRKGMCSTAASFYALPKVKFMYWGKHAKWCLGSNDNLLLALIENGKVGRKYLGKNGYVTLDISGDNFQAGLKYMKGHPYFKRVADMARDIVADATRSRKVKLLGVNSQLDNEFTYPSR